MNNKTVIRDIYKNQQNNYNKKKSMFKDNSNT